MPGAKRAKLDVDADRRAREDALRLARDVRAMRERRGWSQEELGDRAGVGRMVIARLERLEARVDFDLLERIGLAFGRPPTVTFGRDPLEEVADAGHLAVQELVLSVGRAAGYRAGFELPTRPSEPWRSADIALRNDRARLLVIAECWNTFGDIGAAARSSERKRAEADALATAWWGEEPHGVALVWVVRDTTRNRGLLARYPEVFASRFPGSSRAWFVALTDAGAVPPNEPGLVWVDRAATRLFAWRRRSPGSGAHLAPAGLRASSTDRPLQGERP
ncbi:MAG TPA: helix-turn-helix transcriptional regulator [Candidatus Limnocylindrales bacterium]